MNEAKLWKEFARKSTKDSIPLPTEEELILFGKDIEALYGSHTGQPGWSANQAYKVWWALNGHPEFIDYLKISGRERIGAEYLIERFTNLWHTELRAKHLKKLAKTNIIEYLRQYPSY